jgi:hypothetical protein
MNTTISLKISCPLCQTVFPKFSKMVFTTLEDVNVYVNSRCKRCKAQLHQSYWIAHSADNEWWFCIGNRDDINHPVATISGMISTNGFLDYVKLSHWDKQRLLVIRNN